LPEPHGPLIATASGVAVFVSSISNANDETLSWNRWLVCLQIFTGPLFSVFVLWANMREELDSPGKTFVKMVLYTLLGSLVLLAVLLVALTCMALGYGLAYAASPVVTMMITQLLVFVTLMFSPINFPADRLPDWLATVHDFLPFAYMAQAIRESLAPPPEGISALPFVVLGVWCVLGLALAHWVMNRRG
jgi:hypothetical protein